jgi:hypothetical protein
MKQIKETELLIQEQNLVEKRVVCNSVKCQIQKNNDLEVVVCDDAGIRRLKKIENFIVQPHKSSNPCTIYFMKNNSNSGTWGGHVRWVVHDNDDIESVITINLRMDFFFRIVRGDRFVVLIDSDKAMYDKRFILEKLRNKVSGFVKSYILEYIRDNSVSNLFKMCRDISNGLEEKLNENVLYEYGVIFENLNLIIERAI